MEHENKGRCELFDDQEWLVCNIRRFEMIKYSFKDDEEYVAVKEYEYDDLTSISEDGCRAYQEIFHKMDEGWMKDGWEEICTLQMGIYKVVKTHVFLLPSELLVRPKNEELPKELSGVIMIVKMVKLHRDS
ncbi:hypothetical protein Tco_1286473 [Tanacetum coccineum]